MDLREAIRSRSVANLEASLKRGSIRQELMAKNAANGAGPLMLAVTMGRVPVLQRLAAAVTQLVRSARSRECSAFSGVPMGASRAISHGIPWDIPWNVGYPVGCVPTEHTSHPTYHGDPMG